VQHTVPIMTRQKPCCRYVAWVECVEFIGVCSARTGVEVRGGAGLGAR
jgi:hypothetical protein